MLAIKNNIMASNAARHLGNAYDSLATSVERLSSGLRINGAKDDAAGLAVRELIRADIAVLQQSGRNAQDGISMLQTMEGAMAVIDDNLIRMKELAQQAATGTYSDAQRALMNTEFSEMADEIDRISQVAKFNDITLLNSSTGSVSINVGNGTSIDINKTNMTKAGLNINTDVMVQEVLLGDALADTDTTALATVADEAVDVDIVFSNGGTDEDTISITLATGAHTIDDLVAAINTASQALPDFSDGTDQSYDAAEVITNDDGTYSLQISSLREADAVAITVSSAGGTGDLDINHATGTDLTDAGAGGTALNADNYAAAQASGGLNISTADEAIDALTVITAAINTKDAARAYFGSKMQRLESTVSILNIQAENLMSAESRISDVDVATEMAMMTRTQVMTQAGISMLAQANQMPQMALTLLR